MNQRILNNKSIYFFFKILYDKILYIMNDGMMSCSRTGSGAEEKSHGKTPVDEGVLSDYNKFRML